MRLLGRVFFVHSRHVLLMIYPHFQGFLRCTETNMRNKKGYIKFNDNANKGTKENSSKLSWGSNDSNSTTIGKVN